MIDNEIKLMLIEDFACRVRDYAIRREANVDCPLPSINNWYPELAEKVKGLVKREKYFVRNYLTHKDWAYIIYASYFTLENGESLLLKSFPMLNKTNSVKRGGLNLYKRDGWCTHVIVGLFICNICIPQKRPPVSMAGAGKEFDFIFRSRLPKLFSQLGDDDVLVFRIGTLIHDLGVIDGVENHDCKGVKYVQPALFELGIDDEWLSKNNYKWNLEELTFALELFVGQHSFLSKVYSEFGLQHIRKVLQAKFSPPRLRSRSTFLEDWLRHKSLLSLALFLVGDVGAVRDELLTLQALKKIVDSEVLLNDLLKDPNDKSADDVVIYGLNRLKDFLELDDETIILRLISCTTSDPTLLLRDIGRIQRLDYFLTYIKQIPDKNNRILFLSRLITFLNNSPEWITAEHQELNFSPHVDMKVISSIWDKEIQDWRKFLESHLVLSRADGKVIAKFND